MPRHSNAKRQSPRKPEMERKRRRRINDCLSQIKLLIPEAKELEIKKGCRLEKAEILEITVDFIRKMNKKLNSESADKMMQPMTKCPGSSTSVGFGEERPPFINGSTFSSGPAVLPGKFPSCCDLPQDYDPPTPYMREIHQARVYPPILRPTPRFFTPLCVTSNALDHMREDASALCAFPQSLECPSSKDTDSKKLEEV